MTSLCHRQTKCKNAIESLLTNWTVSKPKIISDGQLDFIPGGEQWFNTKKVSV